MITDHDARKIPLSKVLELKEKSGDSVSVVIPALNEGETIGREIDIITEMLMKNYPIVDELIVMDGGSSDATVDVVESKGITWFPANPEGETIPNGKGVALWRSLQHVTGSIVLYVDADIENFAHHFITSLLIPFFTNKEIGYVKGFYERPIVQNGVMNPTGGGRVTELLVRPLFSRFFPEATQLIQPLAGEYGFRTEVAKQLVFYSGYGVETSLTLSYIKKFGSETIAQVDLGERIHRNRPLSDLGRMAAVILQTFIDFAEEESIVSKEQRGLDCYYPVVDGERNEELINQVRLPIISEM